MQSLSSRSYAILVCSLMLMQAVSFGLVYYSQERQTRSRMLSFMSQDAALAFDIVNRAPLQERPAWVKALDRGFYQIVLAPVAGPRLGVRRGLLPELDQVAERVAGRLQRSDVRWVWHDETPALELPLGDGQALHILAEDPLPPPTPLLRAAYLLVLLVTASLVAWMVVRMLMVPLNRFCAAAQALGDDIQSPLLREEGPYEMRQVARVVNQMQERIRRQMDERTEIVSSISHDLQTPITRLRLRADLIDDPALRNKFASDLDGIAAMIREGLDYARSAQLREHRVPIDVNALVESLADQLGDIGHQVQVEGRILRPYMAALRAMERSVLNLLTNAVKFGGSARAVLHEDAAGAHIRIIDPGPGIPAELLERVFEPFYRLEVSRNRDHGGNGLGLAIARNLVRAHGGEITLTNHDGAGFEAAITLPRALRA